MYTDSNGRGQPSRKAEDLLDVLREKVDACRGLFHGLDYSRFATHATSLLVPAANYILAVARAYPDKKPGAIPNSAGQHIESYEEK